MPSTHAMVGFALPFSMFIFTQSRYVYPFWLGFALASVWCLLVCGSRLYLGMHTVLDVIAGVLLSATILFSLAPIIDLVDEFNLSNLTAPFLSFVIVSLMSIYYPQSDRWSPARGDTCGRLETKICVLLFFENLLIYFFAVKSNGRIRLWRTNWFMAKLSAPTDDRSNLGHSISDPLADQPDAFRGCFANDHCGHLYRTDSAAGQEADHDVTLQSTKPELQ